MRNKTTYTLSFCQYLMSAMQGWLAARQVAPDCLFAFDYAVARIALGAIKATRVSALPTTNISLVCVGDPGSEIIE